MADDHPVVRQGLRFCLAKEERFQVVGEAADGEEAVEKALALGPDLVLMDYSMPRLNGLAATERLRREAPKIKVLVLSMHNNREHMLRSIQVGAQGYVSKEVSPPELVRAIERVHSGEILFSSEVQKAAAHHRTRTERLALLTEREREVLVLLAEGKSNKEMAQLLGLGVRTVETHREAIMRRLDIHSAAGLTRFAITQGLVSLNSRV